MLLKTSYKANVKAYVIENGKKYYVKKSPLTCLVTSGSGKAYTSAKSIKVNKSSLSLTAGKTAKLKVRIVKLDASKKIRKNWHVATLRYLTSDKSIATVNKNGKVKGVAKGSCNVYVLAHNGVHKKVRVTVK